MQRFVVSGSAGQRGGSRYAVVDTLDRQGGAGMRRVAFHRTFAAAQRDAQSRNRELHRTSVVRAGALKQARCSCGWEGPRHDTGRWCENDAAAHLAETTSP